MTTGLPGRAREADGHNPLRSVQSSGRTPLVAGAAVGLAVTGLLAVVDAPLLTGLLALGLLVGAPSARRLDRRIALNTAISIGWLPWAMWIPPWAGVRTAAVVSLGLASALTAGMVCARPGILGADLRRTDAWLGISGGLALLVSSPLLTVRQPAAALAMLTGGWDHASHFSMYLEQRFAGAAPPRLPAAVDGSGYYFDHYAQWFHSLLVVLAQMLHGQPGTVAAELVRYTQLQSVLFTMVVIGLVGALLYPDGRRIAGRALVVGVLVSLTFLLGVPGGLNLLQGHLSFLIAAAAPVLIVLLSSGFRPNDFALMAAVLGLLTVAASWLFMLPAAGIGALFVLWAFWRTGDRRSRSLLIVLTCLAAAASTFLISRSLGSPVADHVVADGPIPAVHPAVTLLLLLTAVALLGLLGRTQRRSLRSHQAVAVIGTGAMLVAALAAYQLATAGQLSYYFWKVSLGTLFGAAVLTIHAALEHDRAARWLTRPLPVTLLLLMSSLGLGSALKFYAAPSVVWAAALPAHFADRAESSARPSMEGLLALAVETAPADGASMTLIATRPDDLSTAYAAQWFHGLNRSRTVAAAEWDVELFDVGVRRRDVSAAATLAREVMRRPGETVLVTDPALFSALQDDPTVDASRVRLVLN